MQVGHESKDHTTDYELIISDEHNIDDIISGTDFPSDYEAFNDENLDMIP